MKLPRLRIRYADVAATLALVMAGGGTAYAVTMAPPNSVNTAALVNAAVTAPKLATEAVTSAKLAPGAVTSSKIANGTVSAADIAGADSSGTISASLTAHGCGHLSLAVTGARSGDAVLITWRGSTTPANMVLGPARVSSADHVDVVACNEGGSALNLSGQGIRVMTFR